MPKNPRIFAHFVHEWVLFGHFYYQNNKFYALLFISLGSHIFNKCTNFCLLCRMATGLVRGIEMVSKLCLINNIRIKGEIVAFTPGRNIYMLTLDEVEAGSYVHVHKP